MCVTTRTVTSAGRSTRICPGSLTISRREFMLGVRAMGRVNPASTARSGRPPDRDSADVGGVLTETFEHHIKEEHDALFPKAKRIFNDQELEQMGTRMEAMKGTEVRASS